MNHDAPDEELAVDQQSLNLLDRWRGGDELAAEELFERYVSRLSALARSRMSPKLGRRVDADDVVQSVYRTFFINAREEDRYVLKRSGDLWRLLVGITFNKLHRHIEFHTARKRSIKHEDSLQLHGESIRINAQAVARGPTPAEAVAVADQLQNQLAALDPLPRQILEKRLQGYSVEEIAAEVSRSECSVRRILQKLKVDFEAQLQGPNDANG